LRTDDNLTRRTRSNGPRHDSLIRYGDLERLAAAGIRGRGEEGGIGEAERRAAPGCSRADGRQEGDSVIVRQCGAQSCASQSPYARNQVANSQEQWGIRPHRSPRSIVPCTERLPGRALTRPAVQPRLASRGVGYPGAYTPPIRPESSAERSLTRLGSTAWARHTSVVWLNFPRR
jgi:hypothetical protein